MQIQQTGTPIKASGTNSAASVSPSTSMSATDVATGLTKIAELFEQLAASK